MLRGLVCAVFLLILVPAAAGAPSVVAIQVTPTEGAAPLHVTFTASGDAAAYHWDFGDGAGADGQTAEHTYAAGRWTATLTSRDAAGATSTQTAVVTASGLTLAGPGTARYDRKATFRGAVVPAERNVTVVLLGPAGQKVGSAKTTEAGTFALRARVRAPGAYTARTARASAAPLTVTVVPTLAVGFAGSGARGSAYYFTARLVPARAGTISVKILRGGEVLVDRSFGSRVRVKLDTRRLTSYAIRAEVVPAEGYAGTARVLRGNVVLPRLALGARSVAVAQLGAQLRRLHYAAPASSVFDGRMLDAVYAFQKVQRLPRTGVADARLWRALAAPRRAVARFSQPASHIEVDKALQVLYIVRGSRISLIVPISTAGVPGAFTPVGRFAIYRKVSGFDPSPLGTLYDPMYFTAGYAIHGNPSVPPYPASHGCVRVPMWVAPLLYASNGYGETVYVY